MTQYPIIWKDFCLPTGEKFAAAVCGYKSKVRQLFIEEDPLRSLYIKSVDIDGQSCTSSFYCISLDCPLNHTEKEHLMHMHGMYKDEPVDEATAKIWGKNTSLEIMVEMAKRISGAMAAEALDIPADNSERGQV